MYIITSINAKGGCGKSTIAMNLAAGLALLGFDTLLIDMDPQAQVTQWLGAGDGLRLGGTLASAFSGAESFEQVIQSTSYPNLSFVAASEGLEDVGRQITDHEGYATMLTGMLVNSAKQFTFVVIDSPNQISPIMENAIYPSDLFIVPFESTKAVRSYANFFKLLMRLRPGEEHRLMHVLVNLSRQQGLRNKVIETMQFHGIPRAATEIRTCGWLAQVDEHGGSIFRYRPFSKGAADMATLRKEVIEVLARENQDLLPALVAAQAMLTTGRVVGSDTFLNSEPAAAAGPPEQPAATTTPTEAAPDLPINTNQQP
jgi:chromosome partitioning protein